MNLRQTAAPLIILGLSLAVVLWSLPARSQKLEKWELRASMYSKSPEITALDRKLVSRAQRTFDTYEECRDFRDALMRKGRDEGMQIIGICRQVIVSG